MDEISASYITKTIVLIQQFTLLVQSKSLVKHVFMYVNNREMNTQRVETGFSVSLCIYISYQQSHY